MAFEPGTTINGRYELGRQLGAGGMARVYLAHDRVLDRAVAVKVLADRYASDPSFVERFRREASAAAGLNHPNIVSVYDRGEADSSYYIVMEYLSGPDLKEVIRRRAPLPPGEAVDYALQVLSALGAAHRRDVIHRDVKPQNVMVAEDGHLKVTDFGIARAGAQSDMTEAGSVIGTAQYLSPEQAQGEEVTAASDCYSLGIVLYELLTGRVPFDGDRAMAVAMKQVNEPPVPPRVYEPEIPPALDDVVMRALAKRPVDRYRTAEDFRAALFEVRAGLEGGTAATRAFAAAPTAATQALPAQRPATGPTRVAPIPADEPPSRRRRALPIVLGLIALLVLAGVAFALLTGGAERVEVPPVAGQSQEDALAALETVGLEGDTRSVTDVAEPGTVVGSDPAAGTEVDEGSTVTLTVSGGPETAPVPDVVGDPLEQAQDRLAADGFTARVEERADDAEASTVIAQDPAGGDDAAVNSEVTLIVSSGPDLVVVPRVTGGTLDAAIAALDEVGLVPNAIEEETDQVPEGQVFRQDPEQDTEVEEGATVDVTVATAPDEPTVPNVVGFDAGDAEQILRDAGFDVISEGAFASEPEGVVLQQFPGGGETAPEDNTVRIVVSLGPEEQDPPPDDDTTGEEEENGAEDENGEDEDALPPAPEIPDQGRAPGRGAGAPGRT